MTVVACLSQYPLLGGWGCLARKKACGLGVERGASEAKVTISLLSFLDAQPVSVKNTFATSPSAFILHLATIMQSIPRPHCTVLDLDLFLRWLDP